MVSLPFRGRASRKTGRQPPIPESYDGVLSTLSDATILLAMDRLRRFPLFSPADYVKFNRRATDGLDPFVHAICCGVFEDRQIFAPRRIVRMLDGSGTGGKPKPGTEAVGMPGPIGVYVSSLGNIFMREIAQDLVRDLSELGLQAELRDEISPIDRRPPVSIFVAPHEFFILGRGADWIRDEVVRTSFMLGTEQVQTTWFAKSLPFLLMSRGVIEMCGQTAACLREASVPALHMTPAVKPYRPPLSEEDQRHPLYRVLPAAARLVPQPGTPFLDRPIDISFFGAESPRRHRFFAGHAALLAEFQNVIYLRSLTQGPVGPGAGDASLARLSGHVSGHSKIALNIHQSEFGYFEWHRMVRLGMAAGALVVSDPCPAQPHFKPGVHYLEEGTRQIPNLLEWLLRSPEGQAEAERIRLNARTLFTRLSGESQAAAPLRDFLSEHRIP